MKKRNQKRAHKSDFIQSIIWIVAGLLLIGLYFFINGVQPPTIEAGHFYVLFKTIFIIGGFTYLISGTYLSIFYMRNKKKQPI